MQRVGRTFEDYNQYPLEELIVHPRVSAAVL